MKPYPLTGNAPHLLLDGLGHQLGGLYDVVRQIQSRQESGQVGAIVIVDNTLRQRGLYSSLQRSQPTPAGNGIRVEFENVAFDDLVLWLGDLNTQFGMLVQSGNFSIASGAGPGRVNSTLTLER